MWYWSFTYVVLAMKLRAIFKEVKSLGVLSLGYRKNFDLSV